MQIEISFPGGKRVDATFGSHRVRTDQPADAGGAGSAPGPFDLFLASIGTCAGIYVLGFCQARGIPTDGLEIAETVELDETTHLPSRIDLQIRLPPGFPEKYRASIRRVAEQCKVKRALAAPPVIAVDLASATADEVTVAAGS